MTAEYPNLELLEYIFRHLANPARDHAVRYDLDLFVFPQVWPNTGGGFAEPGYCYGQSVTKQYTTVLFDMHANTAMVAFGNEPAYVISNPNQAFVDDFNRKNMKSKYEAQKAYKENTENE